MSKCVVNEEALKKCQEGYQEFLRVVKSREDERVRRDMLLREWSAADADWNRRHEEQLRLLEAGRVATSDEIFHNNKKYNCRTNKYI
jgi:hypothetical protein